MAEKQINPINLLIDTFWALLPNRRLVFAYRTIQSRYQL